MGTEQLNDILEPHLRITAQQKDQLNELVQILEPYAMATDDTQGDRPITISYVLPCVLSLYHSLSNLKAAYLDKFRVGLLKSLAKRFGGLFDGVGMGSIPEIEQFSFADEIYLISMFLDPQFCTQPVDFDVVASNEAKAKVVSKLKALVHNQAGKIQVQSEIATSEIGASSNPDHNISASESDFHNEPPRKLFRYIKATTKPKLTGGRTICDQIDAYLELDKSTVSNPIEFWANRLVDFPHLSRLALSVLHVPATAAPVERAFWAGSLINRPRCAQNLCKALFVKLNSHLE